MKRWEDNNEWDRLPDGSPAAVIAVMRLAPTNQTRCLCGSAARIL